MTSGYQSNISQYQVAIGSTNKNLKTVSNGSSGQVLTSNGSSADPSFQNTPSAAGYSLSINTGTGDPADASTYFMGNGLAFTGTGNASNAQTRLYIPLSGTINKVYGAITVTGTLASAGSSTVILRLNNTTNNTITSSLALTSASNTFSSTSLGVSVTAGDFIQFTFTSPIWATNPTTVSFAITVLVE